MGHPVKGSGDVSSGNTAIEDPRGLTDADHRCVVEYWMSLKGGAFAPSWVAWDWMRLPMPLIPYFVVADVQHDPLDFRYRFYGTSHAEIYGVDYTGRLISQIRPAEIAAASLEQYAEVLKRREPVVCVHTVEIDGKRVARDQVSIRMPMSSNGTDIDIIVSFADYRASRQDLKKAFAQVRS